MKKESMIKAILKTKPKNIYGYVHELGHLICGWSCCREHCEFEAHGAAKVIAKVLGIDKHINWKKAEEQMSCYAGRTDIKKGGCGRYKDLK